MHCIFKAWLLLIELSLVFFFLLKKKKQFGDFYAFLVEVIL